MKRLPIFLLILTTFTLPVPHVSAQDLSPKALQQEIARPNLASVQPQQTHEAATPSTENGSTGKLPRRYCVNAGEKPVR